jgi:serine/threonine protein kinase
MKNGPSFRLRFGRFQLDPRTGELLKNGRKVAVQEQPFRVLVLLVQHPGELVTRDDLRRNLWPNDTVVEFDQSINTAIRKLRLALGDSAVNPRYIETMGRRGYRFIAQLESTIERSDGGPGLAAGAAARPSSAANTTLIGRKVSHYRVLELAAGGGMGLVYKAEDIRLGRRVALKFLPSELAADAHAVERFEREAKAASALDHRNICPVYEFGEHEQQHFIVMPFLEGATLRHRLDADDPDRNGLPGNELIEIAIQIADALDAAHRSGIIHRDIKPANIFITLSGEAKILDFGVAKLVEGVDEPPPGGDNSLAQPDSLTRTGTIVGTASYMSPEQIRGEKVDTRTDLFSFGLVIYEMATGQQAFIGETAVQVRAAILSHPAAEPRDQIPADLWKIIAKAIDKDRAFRYQTASEMRTALALLERNTAVTSKKTVRRWLALCGAVLLAVAGTAPWVANQRPARHFALIQRKLTTTSGDNHVLSGARISPDGKHLAYVEKSGMRVTLIATGETRSIPEPDGLGHRWQVAGWFPNNIKFIANARPLGQDAKQWTADGTSIWAVPGPASPPYKLRDNAEAFSVSPNGDLIAFGANPGTFGDREIWLMNTAGGAARKLYGTGEDSAIGGLQWSPDAQRVVYLKSDASTDTFISRDLKGGAARSLLSLPASRLHDLLWLADGRMLYILSEPGPVDDSCNIWSVRIDPRTGELTEAPKQETEWAGFCVDSLSATADAKHLVFQRWTAESNVLLASVEDNGTRLGTSQRLTHNDNYNVPVDWTVDGAVIVRSNRNGKWGLFRYTRDANAVASRVIGTEGVLDARVSPDSAWILYVVPANRSASTSTLQRLMRVSITGDAPEPIVEARIAGLSCATSGDSCAIAERSRDGRALIFTELHPLKSPGREFARFDTDPTRPCMWDLSPDGTRIAVLRSLDREIHILAVTGREMKTVVVKGLSGLQNIRWRADGNGFLSSTQVRLEAVLVSIDPEGNWRVLWQQPGLQGTSAVPSRDGRDLAIMDWRVTNNIWMLENF